jgi:hypothetical protein
MAEDGYRMVRAATRTHNVIVQEPVFDEWYEIHVVITESPKEPEPSRIAAYWTIERALFDTTRAVVMAINQHACPTRPNVKLLLISPAF